MRPTSQVTADPFTAALHRQFSNKGSITFRSYSGKAYRMDSDLKITLFPDGKAHLFLYGFTLEGYTGSYQVEPAGRIVAEFKRSSDRPMAMLSDQPMIMLVEQDDRSLLLRPADHHTRYVMGGDQRFWPLRPISGEDEREVLAGEGRHVRSKVRAACPRRSIRPRNS